MAVEHDIIPIEWAYLSPKVQAHGMCSYCSRQATWMRRSRRGWVALCHRHAGKAAIGDPKPVPPADYKGCRVRLVEDIQTKGGARFPKDSIMRVDHVEGRTLTLSMRNPDPKNIFGQRRLAVSRVETHEVELLPKKEVNHGA